MTMSNMYKRVGKFRTSYWYIYEANRLSEQINYYTDPDLVNFCVKPKIALASFYFEAGNVKLAIE